MSQRAMLQRYYWVKDLRIAKINGGKKLHVNQYWANILSYKIDKGIDMALLVMKRKKYT